MPIPIEPPPEVDEPRLPLWKRLAWLFAIAVGGGLAAALVAWAMKALLPSH